MDIDKVGKAISFLRKRAGYTQKDLASRIGISDKAVSKWERGLGLPDIGYLRRLSILLDTDTDSLLSGDVAHHDAGWQGLIVLNENKYGIGAETVIYDKPLIYFLLSYFLLVGIKNVFISCTADDKSYLERTMGNGSDFGVQLQYSCDGMDDLWLDERKSTMVVYGRCLLYGVDQTRFFQKAMINKSHLTILAFPKKNVRNQVMIDADKKVVSSNKDEPLNTQYDYSGIPILLCPPDILPVMIQSGDVEIFISDYARTSELYVYMLDRGFVEIEIDTWDDLQEASTFMKIVQSRCGMNVYCLEEVAWRRGLISADQLKKHAEKNSGTEYGDYIQSLYDRIKDRQLYEE